MSSLGILWSNSGLPELVQECYSHLNPRDLAAITQVCKKSIPEAHLTLRGKLSAYCKTLRGALTITCVKKHAESLHQIIEKLPPSELPSSIASQFAIEKITPTWQGIGELEEFLKNRSVLVVWKKLAGTIAVTDGPDITYLQSFEDYKKEAEKFPQWFTQHKNALSNVRELYLGSCHLTYLPPELGELDIKIFQCSHNHLEELPEWMFNFSNLEELYVENNRLKELPLSIGKLTNLRVIACESNCLFTLPSAISLLSSLWPCCVNSCG